MQEIYSSAASLKNQKLLPRPRKALLPSSGNESPRSSTLKQQPEEVTVNDTAMSSPDRRRSSSDQVPFSARKTLRGKGSINEQQTFQASVLQQDFPPVPQLEQTLFVSNLESGASSLETCSGTYATELSERKFLSEDGTVVRVAQSSARRPPRLYEHKTVMQTSSRRTIPSLSPGGKANVLWTRAVAAAAARKRRPARVQRQPHSPLTHSLCSSSLPSHLDQFPLQDKEKSEGSSSSENSSVASGTRSPRRSKRRREQGHQHHHHPLRAGHPLRNASHMDRYNQLKELLECEPPAWSQMRRANVRQRLLLLRPGRQGPSPSEGRMLRRGLVAFDERRAQDAAARGSTTVLLPPVLAPPVVRVQTHRERAAAGGNSPIGDDDDMWEGVSRSSIDVRPSERFLSLSERICARTVGTPRIQTWPITI